MAQALIVAALLQALASEALDPSPMTVRVSGVRDDAGQVRVDVCSPKTFLRGGCEVTVAVPAVEGETVVTLPAVPAGVWAIQAYHDRNANLRVDRGALGVPTEEVGFSRQAPVGLKGPAFERAAFRHAGPETITVRLRRYW